MTPKIQSESNNSTMMTITTIVICDLPDVHNQIGKLTFKSDDHNKTLNHEITYQSSMVLTSNLTMDITRK